MPAPAVPETITPTHRVGPYDVATTRDILTLRMENRGEFTMKACCAIGLAMLCICAVGVMSIIQTSDVATAPSGSGVMEAPEQFFAPQHNHFGFIWLASSILMLVLVPVYIANAYKAAVMFTFDKAEDRFLCGKKQLSRLTRVEHLRLTEVKDPDARFLYLVDVIYGDGKQVLLHNGYDEREAMNLANEVSIFIRRPVKWR